MRQKASIQTASRRITVRVSRLHLWVMNRLRRQAGTGPISERTFFYSQRGTDEEALKYEPKLLKGGQDALAGSERLRGREAIIVDEWGPYDFQSPRLVLQRPTKPEADAQGRTVYRFDVLGPKGAWKVKQANGAATVSAQSGMVPGTLTITLEAGKAVNLDLQLEYTGGATTDFRGITTPAAKPVPFGYTRFFAPIAWNVRWFGYTPENDPQSQPALRSPNW